MGFRDLFRSSSACSSASSNCGENYYDNCQPCQPAKCEDDCKIETVNVGNVQNCGPAKTIKICTTTSQPQFRVVQKKKTCYKTVCENKQVKCKKTVKVPKEIKCYRVKWVECQKPCTKKVWKCENVCDTKTVKRVVKEPYCKTIMVDKEVDSFQMKTICKKVPYQVECTPEPVCEPVCQPCEPAPVCQPTTCEPCEPVCQPCEPVCNQPEPSCQQPCEIPSCETDCYENCEGPDFKGRVNYMFSKLKM